MHSSTSSSDVSYAIMDPATRHLIEALHESAGKCVLTLTGGGTGAVALLLGIPGGSRMVLEVRVPYHEQALVEYLGHRPAQFCSASTSRVMAERAYERAAWLAPGERVLSVGCTASLATDRPKRGDHRFHLTCRTVDRITTYSLILRKGERQREAEEAVLDSVLLNGLAEASGVNARVPVALLSEESVQIDVEKPSDLVRSLLHGECDAFYAALDGQLLRHAPRPAALLPGAFNPAHAGHRGLAEVASRLLATPVVFELSVTNVDKPTLTAPEVRRRLRQFTWQAPVWVTRAPTFADKATLFPGVVFLVGADTAERILAPRYYAHSETRMALALDYLCRQGCRFLVAGREVRAGTYLSLDDLTIPAAYRDLFSAIPKADFYRSTSSTALRQQSSEAQTSAPAEGSA